ncbi:hypothetical protein DYF80_13330 [Salmonella enterica subsp. enterica]|nr:hypothetical protein [Salmonella enterica subsp. enterica]EHE5269722.1 hypothetical protein [Salmonella enterica subsp. enterica serovar Uganda]EJV0479032.1 hypothetical protein [Salmonella enterica subsp. enterica serovar Uganda]
MGSNIIELVKLGHERAAELKASCGAVDVRSLAQLISDLATQLEVQLVRGNALAAENAGLNVFIEEECFVYSSDTPEPIDANDCKPETKVTDAFLAEVRAQGVDYAIGVIEDCANNLSPGGTGEAVQYAQEMVNPYLDSIHDKLADKSAQLRKGGAA